MASKRKAAPAADDEALALVRARLQSGARQVSGQLLAEDGPVGEPAPVKQNMGWFNVHVPCGREATLKALRLTAVAEPAADDKSEPRTVSVEVPVRARKVPAGGIAYAAVPDVEGLQGDAPDTGEPAPVPAQQSEG
jgi:hypothetical protein